MMIKRAINSIAKRERQRRRKINQSNQRRKKKYLDDGEDGLNFIFEYFEAAGEFAFDFIEGVFTVGGGRGRPGRPGRPGRRGPGRGPGRPARGGPVRRVAPDGPAPKRSDAFRHLNAVFALDVDGQQPRKQLLAAPISSRLVAAHRGGSINIDPCWISTINQSLWLTR